MDLESPPVGVLDHGGRREQVGVDLGEHFVALALRFDQCKSQFIHAHKINSEPPRDANMVRLAQGALRR